MKSIGFASLLGLIVILPACSNDEPTRRSLPIVGGSLSTSDTGVVALSVPISDGGAVLRLCTGTVISARTVLTAARCVHEAKTGGFIDQGRAYFGHDQGNPDRVVMLADARSHRLYDPTLVGKYDIAVVLLAEDAGVPAVALNDQPIEGVVDAFDGTNPTTGKVRSLGYGAGIENTTTGKVSGAGTRRSAPLPVRAIAPRHLTIGDLDNYICRDGDEGGPDLFTIGGSEKVVAIHAGISEQTECDDIASGLSMNATSFAMRVDAVLADFIIPAMDAWEGPCLVDGSCVTTGCRTPDPDCDPCGPEGTCAADCPQADWDCPLGAVVGEACTADAECETRRCVPATDDPRITYCSDTCSAASAGLDCGAELICAQVGAEELCVWPEPTPGAQGFDCQDGTTCRSTFCDLEYHICVEPCDPAAADACPAGFECSPSSLADHVCRPPSTGGGGCAAAPGRRGAGALVFGLAGLAAAALLIRRRRRRPA